MERPHHPRHWPRPSRTAPGAAPTSTTPIWPAILVLIREDSVIDFDWGGGAPTAKTEGDNFSAGPLGALRRHAGGRYRVDEGGRRHSGHAGRDDPDRRAWHDQAATRYGREVDVSPGRHLLRVSTTSAAATRPCTSPPAWWRRR
ncbi:MAG: hypothetical protein U0470_03415 [Anaerolineae bacterium]